MSLIDIENETLRRDILEILSTATASSATEIVIATSLRVDFGHQISKDRLKIQLAWLKEQALITTKSISETNYEKITLTARGLDVAQENSFVPGIARKNLA